MIFQICVAGRVIEIDAVYEDVCSLFEPYIIEQYFPKPDIIIRTHFEDLKNIQAMTHQGSTLKNGSEQVVFFDLKKHEFISIYQKLAEAIPAFDTFLMHGSVIATGNWAYMFTAASGVGKTTRTRLWLDEYSDSYIINGDKPYIKITETEALACGTPWCGKEGWNTNIMLPLRACFLLERAESNNQNYIKEVSFGEAFTTLYQQSYHPVDRDSMRKTLHLLKKLEGKVHFYKFRSAPTTEAIRLAYETARPR